MKKKFLKITSIILLLYMSLTFALEKTTVLLDWFLNPSHAPLFVAIEKGYFKQQNLEVELLGPADPSDPPKLVAAGKADIAITYEPQFIIQTKQGLPLAYIGSLIDHPLTCLAVLKDSPIKSIKDLKDKKIGYSIGGVNNIMLKTMLEYNHLSLSDVISINVHYSLSQALLSKKVDAVTGLMRNFETIQMDLNKHPVRTFYPEQNGVPNYDELIFIVNKNNLHDPRWKRFLTAVKQGDEYLQKHPEEMWNAFAKQHPELNDELNHRAWMATLPYFSRDPATFNKKQWLVFESFMKKNGI